VLKHLYITSILGKFLHSLKYAMPKSTRVELYFCPSTLKSTVANVTIAYRVGAFNDNVYP